MANDDIWILGINMTKFGKHKDLDTVDLAAQAAGCAVEGIWVATPEPERDPALLAGYDAIWCVPGSPYASMAGALAAIRFAREQGVPFLGTCGGFQHALHRPGVVVIEKTQCLQHGTPSSQLMLRKLRPPCYRVRWSREGGLPRRANSAVAIALPRRSCLFPGFA